MFLKFRTQLLHHRWSQQAEMLLDQSVMWFRKVTSLWCDPESTFLSNDYTNPNTNPKTLTTLTLTLTDPRDAFECFCAPIFCDLIWNYFLDSESHFRTPRHFEGKMHRPIITGQHKVKQKENLQGRIFHVSTCSNANQRSLVSTALYWLSLRYRWRKLHRHKRTAG